jgi:DNA polymerase-3 subunit beta
MAIDKHSRLDIEIQQPRLLAALSSANAIADKRSATQPILGSVMLVATKDGKLTVYSSDMQRSLRESLDCEVKAPGAVCINAASLRNVVGTLPAKPLRLVGMENHWLQVKVGRSEFKLMGQAATDFPELPDAGKAKFSEAPCAALIDLIDRTAYSVSEDEARVNLNGALFELDGKRGTMVSTDGHRLTKLAVDLALPKLDKGVIIPRKALADIRKLLERAGKTAEVAIEGGGSGHLFVRAAGITLSVKLSNVVFPPYEQVIPAKHDRRAVVDRQEFIAILKRAEVMAPTKTATVRMQLATGSLQLTADNPDLGVCHEEIEVEYEGKRLTAGFNASYLLDVCGAITTSKVELKFQGDLDPCVVRPVDGPDYLGVVMPMRI